ncbi:WhiB family transcriptional regulator [Gordonia hirsuta]|nr:WhiB family transcriptional regulator [Gordonia hirsuta]
MHGDCRGLDSAMFFHPDGERGPARIRRERQAKQICAACPVIDQCRSHALATDETYGIWGGLTEHERTVLRRRDAQPPRHAEARRGGMQGIERQPTTARMSRADRIR